MSTVETLFASLNRHHVATAQEPLPAPSIGVTWIWAGNGLFKRGVDADRDILIHVGAVPHVPGLVNLMPHVRWRGRSLQLPGTLLGGMLTHARKAAQVGSYGIATPIEQQYHVCQGERCLRVRVPQQQASAAHIAYTMPEEPVLLDLHSHHSMRAYFSQTDDRDDTGLSVSAVIGRIFERPEIIVRANVYGHHLLLPAASVFNGLAVFTDVGEGKEQQWNRS